MPAFPLIHASLKRAALRLARTFTNAVFPLRCQVCGTYFHPQLNDNGQSQNDKRQNNLNGQIDRPVSIDPPRGDIDQMLRARYESLLSPHVCGGCLGGFTPIRHPYCSMCGVVFKSRSDTEHFCGDCIKRPRAFDQARAVALYAPGFMELLHQLKYRGKIQLAGPLGQLLLTAFMSYWQKDHFDLVIPVPLHKKKIRQRGFNQALLLIDDWGGALLSDRAVAGLSFRWTGQPLFERNPRFLRPD